MFLVPLPSLDVIAVADCGCWNNGLVDGCSWSRCWVSPASSTCNPYRRRGFIYHRGSSFSRGPKTYLSMATSNSSDCGKLRCSQAREQEASLPDAQNHLNWLLSDATPSPWRITELLTTFSRLYLQTHSFVRDPSFMNRGEGSNEDF